MPITIRTLIESRDRPITISSDASVHDALEVMLRHDFTQLPVTDPNDAVLGLITSDSIVRALGAFGVEAAQLQVRDAMRAIYAHDPDDDIAELLDSLRDSYAAVVVGSDKRLIAIVTGFDIAEHFRKQFEDLMVVQDIETAVKEHVQFAFSRLGLGQPEIEAAIRRVGDPEDRVQKRVEEAVKLYARGVGAVNQQAFECAIAAIARPPRAMKFDRLTLVQYCELLLGDQYWDALGSIHGGMKQATMRTLLNRVQKSRNALAHFRGELTALERAHLRVCSDWFAQHPLPNTLVAPSAPALTVQANDDSVRVVPAEEPSDTALGRYARLADWLVKRPDSEMSVTVTFDQIEVCIQSPLPKSAFGHRSWWANDSVSHPQSVNWLDVGWRVANLSLTNRVVTFARIEGRQGAYIGFFSAALKDLRARVAWGVAGQSPNGANWQLIAGMTLDGRQLAILAWSFARRKRFRAELYIDCGDAQANKRLFDALRMGQAAIEMKVGRPLAWERMDDRRASRVAMYSEGSIQDSAERLTLLRNWAVDAAIAMHDCLLEEVRTRG